MVLESKPFTFDRVVRILITVGCIAGLIWLLGYLSDVLIPFAAGLLLAYLINPLVSLIEKKAKSRAVSVFISLFLVVAAVSVIILLITPMIVNEIKQMGRLLTDLVNDSTLAERAKEKLPPDLWLVVKEFTETKEVQEFFKQNDLLQLAQSTANTLMPGIFGVISGAASFFAGLLGLFIVVLYVIFLLLDFRKVAEKWQEMLPPPWREPVQSFLRDFKAGMQRYFRAQAAIAFIVGILFAIGFTLIGLPLGIVLGLFIGLLNMVPYLQIIGIVPAAILATVHALESGLSIWFVFGLTGSVFVVVQVIQDTILVPRIMGKVTGLSPAIILLSLSVWGKLLGMLGLLIALPITCLLWAYYQRLITSVAEQNTKARQP
jgi:predicted PurR-regulated permease PerM